MCTSLECCADTMQADYLMIVDSHLLESEYVETLASHRADYNCYNVAIVSDATVAGHSQEPAISDSAIKAFVHDLYHYDSGTAEHMPDGQLGYVLLVGDAEEGELNDWMPAHEHVLPSEADPFTTDHWYACVVGDDAYADLMIGRLCARTTTELETEVRRFVDYETTASSTEDPWRDHVFLSCGFAWRNCPDNEGDERMAASVDTTFDAISALLSAESDYAVRELHAHALDGDDCNVQYEAARLANVDSINAGCHIVELCVHGNPKDTQTFTWQNVAHLDNAGELPFWMSYSCRTGAYDAAIDDDPPGQWRCFGERLLHQNDTTGVIGYFGASEGSPKQAWEYMGQYVWEAFVEQHLHEIGQFIQYAKLKHLSTSAKEDVVWMYNLLGDPALNLALTDYYGYGSAPDLAVSAADLSVSPPFPSHADAVTFRAVIHNNSNYDHDCSFEVVFSVHEADGSDSTHIGTDTVQPPAWASMPASVTWDDPGTSDVGRRLLRVRIRLDTVGVGELFTDNNVAELPFGIYFEQAYPNFPFHLGAAGGLPVTLADINGEPGVELLAQAHEPGKLVAFSGAGDSLWSFPDTPGRPIRGPAAVGDLNFNGTQEVVVCYGDSVVALSGSSGNMFWAAPYHVPGLRSGPALGDLFEGDGHLEVLVEASTAGTLGQHQVVLIKGDGSDEVWTYAIDWDPPQSDFPATCPALADLDRDGLPNALSSFTGPSTGAGPQLSLVAVNTEGDADLWSSELGELGGVTPCNPVVADVSESSEGLEVLCGARDLRCFASDGLELWTEPLAGCLAGLAVEDLDGDGDLEIVATTYGRAMSGGSCGGRVQVFGSDGTQGPGMDTDYGCQAQPVVADLDGDGLWEVIVVSSCPRWTGSRWIDYSHLSIYTDDPATGFEPFEQVQRPLFFSSRLASSPTLADANGNGNLEIWLVDGDGYLHSFEYWGEEDGVLSRWTGYQHDERHTGTYETPLSGAYPEDSRVSWWGDYLMTGDVVVDSTSDLVVQPGTTVRVIPDDADNDLGVDPDLCELIVEGSMRAKGDSIRPTRFISAAEDPVPGQWRGIRLVGTAGADTILGCEIRDAFIGLDASSPRSFTVRGCLLAENDVMGIRCWGDGGASEIELKGNRIEFTQTGIRLRDCAAHIDSNAIWNCGSYGVKVGLDHGSDIERNRIGLPEYPPSNAFSGIYIQGSLEGIRVADNDLLQIPREGIHHELSGDEGVIEGNRIQGYTEPKTGIATGMYFYDANPWVARNTIDGKHNRAYHVAGEEGWDRRPRLGPSWPDSTNPCPGCTDTTSLGCNRAVTDAPPNYYIYVQQSLPAPDVMAKCNYWGAKEPQPSQFSGPVTWRPYLAEDPGSGRQKGGDGGPLRFALTQNFPNPFNPTTVFRYCVPERARVWLVIYNLAGRVVRTLEDSVREPGWYECLWDGRDNRGLRAASGVYFCRLEADRSRAVKKLVLVK